MEIEATKFYIRYREGLPETEMQDYARRGMWTLNVETASYEWIDDIDNLEDLGPTVGLAGYIGDVHRALQKLGKPIPENVDYPQELFDHLGRRLWKSTLEEVRSTIGRVFVKPVEHKAFTGFVWTPDMESRMRIVTHSDDTPVWMADLINIRAEYRCFILYNKIIDCRRYKGDWSVVPSRDILESAVESMKKVAPHAYCLDWGVTDEGKTILVEMNEGYAFGHYGLQPVSYARMLSARWKQMVK